MNATPQEEREYLEEIKEKLTLAIRRIDDAVRRYSNELREKKQYIHEHQSGMDEADMVSAEQSINRMAYTGEGAVARKRRLLKLGQSPYFGRIDFATPGKAANPVYIGVYSFLDETQRQNLIYDWRAPISSLFYDFELGEASYPTPSGTVKGTIELKRQYKIRDGRLEYLLDSDVNIHDDVLQQELAKSSDDKMKNIVATIQRDQNAVIRNETAPVMIIQGVAGSGKTSIALHRIAFLLYRYRDTLAAKDVLIISPNKVFADYISNVLPELGEEHIPELGMDEVAADLLDNRYTFQTFFEQVSALLERHDAAFIERIRFKSSFEFLSQLNQYLLHVENNYFSVADLRVGRTVVPGAFIQQKFKAYHRVPLLKRFGQVANDVRAYVRDKADRKLTGGEKAAIGEGIPRMFRYGNVLEFYRDFYRWLGRPELLKLDQHRLHLEYADVFPLIYLRLRLEGLTAYDHVKHLLVDEMQDYTPVQYAVLSRLFPCRKTILGDVSQTVNPYSASSAEAIERVFPQADVVKLYRSYRSTLEITAFAQRISPNPHIIPLERHGQEPAVLRYPSPEAELEAVRALVTAFPGSGSQSLGVICKTLRQAERAYEVLQGPGVALLTEESTTFKDGVIITTAHLAKGLEFDAVIVPFASTRTYKTEVDRSMLYVACTRAMHQLTLTYSGELTTFLGD
ncbi:DNA helicase-2/ATP-dependent DNA helicase PcrA [Hymenobacter luteus]|uniref:DNA helicase-2/ATP-dependent DNA helicase PcrA n=2 Tax=Hymenobacter TaxID=89966 RepID=A0A7W9SXP5_9BACT|nr:MULTISPECIES: ATP-binding domain-containing protein [Hymenobacter]MBB4599848.1 DNA helicase-2/ATP-dependent DNA helicase PcrA [Hymenobacter latericoloratus]MBB6057842.1 DNA helicase-2/ATP-dependent DNA helicase PcrA [Hymenobacter luteus]